VLQAAKSLAVDDSVAVALEGRSNRILGFSPKPPLRIGALGGLRRQDLALAMFELFADRQPTGRLRCHALSAATLQENRR
jgi:hypothetical protein